VEALDDPTVAVAGPFGLTTADLCDYERGAPPATSPPWQGYCLAARRADLVAAGGVQEAFTWYRKRRHRRVAAPSGLWEKPVRRAVAAGAGPLASATHPPGLGGHPGGRPRRASGRRNMGVVHEVFFGRKDLTVP